MRVNVFESNYTGTFFSRQLQNFLSFFKEKNILVCNKQGQTNWQDRGTYFWGTKVNRMMSNTGVLKTNKLKKKK